ncbi:MAG TPA: alpha/beta hydrolase [Pyrinomonadaceae bacterium]|nr:alpha/beta hydrolase [Pyrinomonadaceae bacterium]
MPSIQSRAVEFLVRLLRVKRSSNRLRQRLASGKRTYTEPTRRHRRKFHVTKSERDGHLVWTLAPKQNAGKKHVIYLHGGGYVNSFASQHWNFMTRLVAATGCTITAPNYPHAPEYHVRDVFEFLLPLYAEVAAVAGSTNVTVMGDSSGGGISLALVQLLREKGREQPGNVVLLAPWLDATMSNPEVRAYDKIDPFLGFEGLKYAASLYATDIDPANYLASPIYGSLRDLAPISLFIGTRDIFLPDCRKLRDKAAAEGVALNYREYEAMLHDWMLISLPESKHALRQIVEIIAPWSNP